MPHYYDVVINKLLINTMAQESKVGNPLVAGAVIAGVAVAATLLSKKETRNKAKKLLASAAKKGADFLERPEGKALTGAIAGKIVKDVTDGKDNGDEKKGRK